MVWNHGPFLPVVVIRLLDVVNAKVVKATYSDGIEQQYASCLGNKRDLDGVETETDRFSCSENSPKDTNVMRELLRRVRDCANPVIDDIMPKLLEVHGQI